MGSQYSALPLQSLLMLLWLLHLLTVVLTSISLANGQLFARIVSVDSPTIPQCSEVQIQFGGGLPPYFFDVWSYYDQMWVAATWVTDSPGVATWTVQHPVNSVLYQFITDSEGFYVQSHPFRVLSPSCDSSTVIQPVRRSMACSCDTSIPEFQRADQIPFSTTSVSVSSPSVPTPTVTDIPSAVPTELDDCGSQASCSFTPTSTGSTYPQQTLIGAAFDNCQGNITVKQTFSGSVTVTNNWSISSGGHFSLPEVLSIDVSAEHGHSKAVTMSQSFEYDVPPQVRAALVGTASFDAVFGIVMVKHSNGPSSPVDAIYFMKDNQPPTVHLHTIGCNESWPVWNAMSSSEDNIDPDTGGANPTWIVGGWGARVYLVMGLILLVW